MALGVTDVRKIKLEPDEALLVTVKGHEIDERLLADVKKRLVETIPNADMGRVFVIAVDEETSIEFDKIKMDKLRG
jgi:hypothetical protein